MQPNQHNGERASASALNAAAIGIGAASLEQANAIGHYDATLRALKPQHEREGRDLFTRMIWLRNQLNLRVKAQVHGRPMLDGDIVLFRKQLDELGIVERAIAPLYEVIAEQRAPNVVVTQGKNFALDAYLAGSAYTAAWYMGLISSIGYAAGPVVGDTAASHAGWTEAGVTNAPTYTGNRKTTAWAAASAGSKALSAGLVFTFTGAGTVKGCFLSTIATVDSGSGSLYSAGLFTGGDQPVVSTNTLTCQYTASL